jgi:hypothetical protein
LVTEGANLVGDLRYLFIRQFAVRQPTADLIGFGLGLGDLNLEFVDCLPDLLLLCLNVSLDLLNSNNVRQENSLDCAPLPLRLGRKIGFSRVKIDGK